MESLRYKQHLINGICPDSDMDRGAPFLELLQNLRCDRFGAKPFDTLTQPWSDSYLNGLNTKLYPYPQYFQLKTVGLLCFEDEIYTVNYSAGTATLLSVKDFSDLTTAFDITGTGPWHLIDLYGTWMLFNGTSTIMQIGVGGPVYGTNEVTIKTGCDYRETRAFFGGFNPSNCYALADWATYLAGYDDNIPDDVRDMLDGLAGGLGRNSVWWSSWYGSDLLWLFSLTYMKFKNLTGSTNNGYSEADPFWRHLRKMGQSGNRVMPWQGDVVRIQELGEGVMVYGKTDSSVRPGGACGLVPVDAGSASTFGIKRTAWPTGMGIATRSAAGGDAFMHVAVSEEGELWTISADFVAERAGGYGYRDVFSDYVNGSDEIVVSLDTSRRDFYISDGTQCHVLTPTGLCKAPWMPTTLYFHNGDRTCIYFDDISAPNEVLVKPKNANISPDGKIRTVTYLKHTGKNNASHPVQFALEYRVNNQVDFTTTAYVTAEADGEAWFNIPCTEFRWILKVDNKTYVTVEDVEVGIGEGTARGTSWPASSVSAATE